MKNNEIVENTIVKSGNRKIELTSIKDRNLLLEIKRIRDYTFDNENLEFFKRIYAYPVILDMPFFNSFFYKTENNITKMDVNCAKEYIPGEYIEEQDIKEYIISQINTNNIFSNTLSFEQYKDLDNNVVNMLCIKDSSGNLIATIENYSDLAVEEEIFKKATIYRIPVKSNNYGYNVKEADIRMPLSTYIIILSKKKLKEKKIPKIMDDYRKDEQEYFSRYLNLDIDMKQVYEDTNINIYFQQ